MDNSPHSTFFIVPRVSRSSSRTWEECTSYSHISSLRFMLLPTILAAFAGFQVWLFDFAQFRAWQVQFLYYNQWTCVLLGCQSSQQSRYSEVHICERGIERISQARCDIHTALCSSTHSLFFFPSLSVLSVFDGVSHAWRDTSAWIRNVRIIVPH